jgi:DNA repair protein RecN (Recombination protein N)
LLSKYYEAYERLDSIRKEIDAIKAKEIERERLIEILEYQIKDIDSLSLKENEEEELIDKKVKIKNSERITKNAGFVYKALRGSEKGSIALLLDKSITALSSLSDVIGEFDSYAERLRDCLDTVEDIAEEVYAAVEEIDDDPTERLNEIESRLDKISKIKRKYGLTLKDVLAFRDNAADELESLKNAENILAELNSKLDKAYDAALSVAMKIHERRQSYAAELEEKVKSTLEFLDMPKVVFFTSITQSSDGERFKLTPDGIDEAVFYISANRGIEPQPLSKIASGGELSRVMLALKSVISEKGATETLIFDEIDAGVSGKTARKIGIKMMELSKSSQIICVTHSAQIASLSDGHFLIEKRDVDGKTASSVTLLDDEGRIKELSRILGGINVTDSQKAAAKDMLKEREIYK